MGNFFFLQNDTTQKIWWKENWKKEGLELHLLNKLEIGTNSDDLIKVQFWTLISVFQLGIRNLCNSSEVWTIETSISREQLTDRSFPHSEASICQLERDFHQSSYVSSALVKFVHSLKYIEKVAGTQCPPLPDEKLAKYTDLEKANTISSRKWLFRDTASKSVMFLASKSRLLKMLNSQHFVTSLTSELQLCKVLSISGLQHFWSSFWTKIQKFECFFQVWSIIFNPPWQHRCIQWNIQPLRLVLSVGIEIQ